MSHEYQSRPTGWDWCPEKKCILSAHVIAPIYGENDRLDPKQEYHMPDEDDSPVCSHMSKNTNKEEKFDVPLISSLFDLCVDFIIKKGHASNIKNLAMLPESVCDALFSRIVKTYNV